MESQPQPPHSPPSAKPESSPAGAGAGAAPSIRPVQRLYPKPPPFLTRILLLALRPESWAEAARYPSYITLVPLIVVILLGALAASTGQAIRQALSLNQFVAGYDRNYPPMELSSEGVLSTKGNLKGPVRVPLLGGVVLVDPTGKTNAETVQAEPVMGFLTVVITDKYIVQVNRIYGTVASQPISELGAPPPFGSIHLPAKGEVKVINGSSLKQFVDNRLPALLVLTPIWAVLQGLAETAWVALMIFLLCPLIIMVAAGGGDDGEKRSRTLILPRRAAVRMAAGLLVPLVVMSAVLRAWGHPIADVLGESGAMFFWMLSSGALAVWTGIMARRMYGGKRANG